MCALDWLDYENRLYDRRSEHAYRGGERTDTVVGTSALGGPLEFANVNLSAPAVQGLSLLARDVAMLAYSPSDGFLCSALRLRKGAAEVMQAHCY